MQDFFFFFFFLTCGSSASESWVWRWCSYLACKDPGGAKCVGTRTAFAPRLSSIRVVFWASCSWWSEGLLGQSSSIALPVQALRGLLCLGSVSVACTSGTQKGPPDSVLLCRLVHQALKWAHWIGSYFGVQSVRHLKGQPPYCSAVDVGVWGERPWWRLHPLCMQVWLNGSSIPCFHGCLAFLHRHFPSWYAPSRPLNPSLCSQWQPSPWDCSTVP